MVTIGAQLGTYYPVQETTTTKQTVNTDPGSKSTRPYNNDNQADELMTIHGGKVDKGDGYNFACGGGQVKDGREREGLLG